MDSEDLSKGWLINKLLGRRDGEGNSLDEEERPAFADDDDSSGHAAAGGRKADTNRWGSRAVSISADDHHDRPGQPQGNRKKHPVDSNTREDELQRILEDDEGSEAGGEGVLQERGQRHRLDVEDEGQEEREREAEGVLSPGLEQSNSNGGPVHGVLGGEEWRDQQKDGSSSA